jgi:DNA-binding NarL/FixJ family response regulator
MFDRTRIVIIDDHPLFREGVAATLRSEPSIDVVGQGATADDAIELCAAHLPDVLLLDIGIVGDGLTAARHITGAYPGIRVVMLTASDNEEHVSVALDVGAKGYILKGIDGGELVNTVLAIRRGETYVTPGLAARILSVMRQRAVAASHDDIASLTPREDEILALVGEGRTNKEIARNLGISEKTVKHYMTNIMEKLQVRNRVEAALAMRGRASAVVPHAKSGAPTLPRSHTR